MATHRIVDPSSGGGSIIADRELYTDATRTKLLEAGDPAAAFLVVSHPGKPIPHDVVAELGLELDNQGRVKQRDAGKDKSFKGAQQDKDATPPVADGEHGWTISSMGADDLKGLKVAQLKEIAEGRHVPGFERMNKEELVAAIVEGGAMQAGGANPDQDPAEGMPEDETREG